MTPVSGSMVGTGSPGAQTKASKAGPFGTSRSPKVVLALGRSGSEIVTRRMCDQLNLHNVCGAVCIKVAVLGMADVVLDTLL